EHALVSCNGDLVASGWDLPVRPGGRIRPARLSDCRRSGILSLNDSKHAAEQECWKEQSKKERATLLTHGINLRTRRRQDTQLQSIARQSGAPQMSAQMMVGHETSGPCCGGPDVGENLVERRPVE